MEEIKILIIEDDQIFAGLLQNYLAQIGFNPYNIITVDSISETKKVKEEFEPDVILLDLNIADSFGIDSYDQVHAIFENTTVVVLSGLDDKNISLEIVSRGAQDYLLKTEINARILEKTIKYGMLRRSFRIQLANSEKKYKDLFYNSPLPMIKLSEDNLTILFCNQAAYDLYEGSPGCMEGKPLNVATHSIPLVSVNAMPRGGKQQFFKHKTCKGKEITTEIILNKLQEDKDTYIALVVDRTEEIDFEKKKYEIVTQAEEKEKKNIARDLHDGLGQQLVLLNLLFQNLPVSSELKAEHDAINLLMQSSIREVKEMAYSLLPPELESGFLNAIDRLVHRMNVTGKMKVHIEKSNEINEASFKKVDRFNLYRIIQEVMNNALKHSKANEINIQMSMVDKKVVFEIQDNGVGFDINKSEGGLGLQNMKHRISMTGIKGDISSEKGHGVKVKLVFET